jgi:hypothetical protein
MQVHLGRMEDGEVINALLLESTRPVSLAIHLPNKALGERIQVVLVYTVHTEDEIERVAKYRYTGTGKKIPGGAGTVPGTCTCTGTRYRSCIDLTAFDLLIGRARTGQRAVP